MGTNAMLQALNLLYTRQELEGCWRWRDDHHPCDGRAPPPRQRQFTGKPGGNLTGTCALRSFWSAGTGGHLEQQMAAGKRLYLLTERSRWG